MRPSVLPFVTLSVVVCCIRVSSVVIVAYASTELEGANGTLLWKGRRKAAIGVVGALAASCYDFPAMLEPGVDIIEIDRIDRALAKFGPRFLRRVYTPLEAAFCRGRTSELAARFAAKEAVMKALGTGARGVAWREIEVLPNHRGKPLVYLHGRAQKRAERIGLDEIDISMSHSRDFAVAFVAARSRDLEPDRDVWRAKFSEILRDRGLLDA